MENNNNNSTLQKSEEKANDEKIIEKKIKINFIHSLSIEMEDQNFTVLDIKKQISKKLLLKTNEYDLFISNFKLDEIHNKLTISTLFKQFNTNIFTIKSFKNIFDIQKQLKDYDNYLTNKLIEKEEEIRNFNSEYEKLLNDLSNL